MVADRYESVPDFESGIRRIQEDDTYVFVWSYNSATYAIADKPCQVSTIERYRLLPTTIAMYIQKNSQFSDMFNV